MSNTLKDSLFVGFFSTLAIIAIVYGVINLEQNTGYGWLFFVIGGGMLWWIHFIDHLPNDKKAVKK